MKPASILTALILIFTMTAPVATADAANAYLTVGASELCATVPLCTYWYLEKDNRGITPVMAVTNDGFTPITISGARLVNSETTIQGIHCNLYPSERVNFALTENPEDTVIQYRAAKCAVIFTITKIGE